jgi:hypothetical protein
MFDVTAGAKAPAFLAMVVTLAIGPIAPVWGQQNATRQASGAIEGRVTDAVTGDPLPGAKILVADSSAETSSDREGRFRLAAVPAGEHSVVVTYLGRPDVVAETTVIAGVARQLDVQMGLAAFEATVTVRAELIQGAQERALNQQKTAPNITNVVSADQIGSFPDRNSASETNRGNQDVEVVYTPALGLNELNPRYYQVNRSGWPCPYPPAVGSHEPNKGHSAQRPRRPRHRSADGGFTRTLHVRHLSVWEVGHSDACVFPSRHGGFSRSVWRARCPAAAAGRIRRRLP